MGSACTIICCKKKPIETLGAIKNWMPGVVESEGNADSWTKIRVVAPRSTITFSSLMRERPGDRFSKLVLSFHNFVNKINTSATANKAALLSRVANAEWLIGVVAEPEFVDEDRHFEALGGLCELLDAVIFNGSAMLDSSGDKLLDASGNFEVAIQGGSRGPSA